MKAGRICNGFSEIEIDINENNTIKVVPMDDIMLEIVWSYEHKRMVCIAKEKPIV